MNPTPLYDIRGNSFAAKSFLAHHAHLTELLFLNDTPVRITKDPRGLIEGMEYDCFLSYETDNLAIPPNARNMLIKANQERFEQLWTTVNQLSLAKLQGITIWTKDGTSMSRLFKQRFRIIEAAGGVVSKGDQILLIHRLGKWDLPKGNIEKGEQKITAAVRELMEECSVQVVPITKLCSTWHTYTRDKVVMLKETTWYAMACIDDTTMRPQLEEGVDKVSWLPEAELNEVLNNSYAAIRYVINTYRGYAAFATARKLLG